MSIISAAENTFACRVRNGASGWGTSRSTVASCRADGCGWKSFLRSDKRAAQRKAADHACLRRFDKLPDALQLMKDKPRDLIKPVVRLL